MFRFFSIVFLLCCFFVQIDNGFCQNDHPTFSSSDQPINITSKRFSAKNFSGGKEVTFEGSVRVQQGDLVLTCDRLIIMYDEKMQGTEQNGSNKKT